jgi:hypothetical protein
MKKNAKPLYLACKDSIASLCDVQAVVMMYNEVVFEKSKSDERLSALWRNGNNIKNELDKQMESLYKIQCTLQQYTVETDLLYKALISKIKVAPKKRVDYLYDNVLLNMVDLAGLKEYYNKREQEGVSIRKEVAETRLYMSSNETLEDFVTRRFDNYKNHLSQGMKNLGITVEDTTEKLKGTLDIQDDTYNKRKDTETAKNIEILQNKKEECYITQVEPLLKKIIERDKTYKALSRVITKLQDFENNRAYVGVLYHRYAGQKVSYSFIGELTDTTKSLINAKFYDVNDKDAMQKLKDTYKDEVDFCIDFIEIY